MNIPRLATEAEVESIKDKAALDSSCTAIAWDTEKGTVLAVIRRPIELDPVIFPESFPDKLKYFFWLLEATGLKHQGADCFYFNIKADDASMLKVAESLGAEPISEAPEIRFKKAL